MHALTKVCCTGLIPCKKWIWCSGLMQIKYILALGEPPTCSFYLKSFCKKYYCNFPTDWGEFEVSRCQLWQILFLCHTLQTIPCLLTLYLRQFPLLMAEMWRALKSHSRTYRSSRLNESTSSALCSSVYIPLKKKPHAKSLQSSSLTPLTWHVC